MGGGMLELICWILVWVSESYTHVGSLGVGWER